MSRLRVASGFLAFLAFAGCDRAPTPVVAPAYSPTDMTNEAFALYDANKDGKIDAAEAKMSPSLSEGLVELDRNKNGAIERDELEAAIQQLVDMKAGVMESPVQVTRGGSSAEGVKIRLIPEKFAESVTKPAEGISADNGSVLFTPEDPSLPAGTKGVQPGFYRIEAGPAAGPLRPLAVGRFASPIRRGLWNIRVN